MGNTSTSQKGNFSADVPRAAKDLDGLLPSLRERFEDLAGIPAAAAAAAALQASTAYTDHPHQHRQDPGGGGAGGRGAAAAAAAAAARREGEGERFLLFDDWMQIPGPRGAEVAKRVYGVLDSDGDGRLDFEEFARAACLLKASPDEDKLALLFKMYGDAGRGGLVCREGLKVFILDIIAASPPLNAPPPYLSLDAEDTCASSVPLSAARQRQQNNTRTGGRASGGGGRGDGAAGAASQPDFEQELDGVLAKMAGVVLSEYDADGDGLLTEKEWKAYLKREEESVSAFLETLSESVGKLLLP
ncbi:unnamed protein product [Scytosiphon promiscuus]